MIRHEARPLRPAIYSLSRQPSRRSCRSVLVRVMDDHREVDSFEVSKAENLRAAIRPLYRHITRGRETVEFLGLEKELLPLGITRTLPTVNLGNLAEAIIFLGS